MRDESRKMTENVGVKWPGRGSVVCRTPSGSFRRVLGGSSEESRGSSEESPSPPGGLPDCPGRSSGLPGDAFIFFVRRSFVFLIFLLVYMRNLENVEKH